MDHKSGYRPLVGPKGWPIDGLARWRCPAAKLGRSTAYPGPTSSPSRWGYYDYDKGLSEGLTTPVIRSGLSDAVCATFEDEYPGGRTSARAAWMPRKKQQKNCCRN